MELATIITAYFFYDKVVGIVNTELASALNSSYNSQFVATSTAGVYDYTPGDIISKGIDAVQIKVATCYVLTSPTQVCIRKRIVVLTEQYLIATCV